MTTQITPTQTSPPNTFVIRPASPSEATQIGQIAAETYYDTPLTEFLSPKRAQYYSDYERAFVQRARKRLLDPRCLSIVACEASRPDTPIAYAHFMRMGDDEGAKKQIASRGSWRLSVLGWLFRAWWLVVDCLVGDKSVSQEALRVFLAEGEKQDAVHWRAFEERSNRWHAQSVVVREAFQGKGIGKLMMGEVIRKAEEENVVVGLEASGPGTLLYRKVGFELLGTFDAICADGVTFLDAHGGIMMWTPPAWKAEKI